MIGFGVLCRCVQVDSQYTVSSAHWPHTTATVRTHRMYPHLRSHASSSRLAISLLRQSPFFSSLLLPSRLRTPSSVRPPVAMAQRLVTQVEEGVGPGAGSGPGGGGQDVAHAGDTLIPVRLSPSRASRATRASSGSGSSGEVDPATITSPSPDDDDDDTALESDVVSTSTSSRGGPRLPYGCWRTFMSYFCFARGAGQKLVGVLAAAAPEAPGSRAVPLQPLPQHQQHQHHQPQQPSVGGSVFAVPRPLHSTPFQRSLLPASPRTASTRHRKCLVLDLDETLVHSSFKPISDADFTLTIELDGASHAVFVRKRPGVDYFLRYVAQRFEVVVFTASLAKYADPLLDKLDPERSLISARLFRESCVQHYGNYVKDLTHLGRPLEHVLIVDNSPFSYLFQPQNAVPCASWFHDTTDLQLYEMLPFLDRVADAPNATLVIADAKREGRYSFFGAPTPLQPALHSQPKHSQQVVTGLTTQMLPEEEDEVTIDAPPPEEEQGDEIDETHVQLQTEELITVAVGS